MKKLGKQQKKQKQYIEDTDKKKYRILNQQLVANVAQNRTKYSKEQVEKPTQARKLYPAIGAPSVRGFECMIWSNQNWNIPVKFEDIDLEEKIFEPEVLYLKGKPTNRNPSIDNRSQSGYTENNLREEPKLHRELKIQ